MNNYWSIYSYNYYHNGGYYGLYPQRQNQYRTNRALNAALEIDLFLAGLIESNNLRKHRGMTILRFKSS